MSMLRHLVPWLLMLFVIPGFAQNPTDACESLASYKDVLKCAVQKHPDAQRSRMILDQNRNLEGIAKQIPNPELSSQILGGKTNSSDRVQYTQVNLAQTIELGGKRSARIERSKAQIVETEMNAQVTQEEVYLRTYIAMVRLRQINDEIEVYDDALTTFERIQKQYRRRPRMTPEQNATYSIMDIAASDYKIRRQPLVNESRAQARFLELAVGRKFDVRKDFFPPKRKDWPAVPEDKQNGLVGANIRRSAAELNIAKAELDEAKSLSWPDLKIGPTFETQTQGSEKYDQLGVNVAFTLPLFNINGSGRSYARAGVSVAEASLSAVKRRELDALELSRATYNDAVASLKTSLSLSELHRRHKDVENSFANGIIPSSLILEIHRQLADYTRSLNEQEITAIEALARIYSIEGRLLTEGL